MPKKTVSIAFLFLILIFGLSSNLVSAEEDQDNVVGAIMISTDKLSYLPEESILISGEVTERKMPVIALRIFDPEGKILGAYNVELDENNFSKVIMADIPFYEKPGIYLVTAEYGKLNSETIFEIENDLFETEYDAPEINEYVELSPKILSFQSDKEIYQDEDIITLNGRVSTTSESQVIMTIFDPFGAPIGIYLADVNPDLTFSTSFLAKYKMNFKVEGVYLITAQYEGHDTKQSLTVKFIEKIDPQIVTDVASHSFLFSEPDLKQLAAWHYLNDNDSKLASFFSDLLKRDLMHINVDSTISKDLLVKWIKDNETTLGFMIEDLFEGNISEETFILFIEDSLNDYVSKVPGQISQDKVSPNITPAPKKILKTESKELDILKDVRAKVEIDYKNDGLKKDEKIVYLYSNVNCEKGTYEDVISHYNSPGPAFAHLCKYKYAISYYDQTLELNPKNIHALTNKGSALASLGNYQDAISYYDKVLEIDPQYVTALNNKEKASASSGLLLSEAEPQSVAILTEEISPPKEREGSPNDIVTQFVGVLSSIGASLITLFS